MNPFLCLAAKASRTVLPLLLLAGPSHGHGHVGQLVRAMKVTVLGEEIRVTLAFTNLSHRVVWLEKNEEGQAPLRSEFEIRSFEGRLVPYVGPMAKRGPYGKADFFALEPGRSYRREIRIDDRYGFPEGQRDYRVTFSYPSWNLKTREAAFHTLPSARFSYAHN